MILHGDSHEVLKTLDDNSVDAVVTDPPWALKFMQKKWDYQLPSVEHWREVLRVLKPGGHALICCGTRTQHRMVVNAEDAGFEIRDVITHLYGSGFPKSHDVSKGIDKAAGAEREVIGTTNRDVGPSQKSGFKGTSTFKESADNPGNLLWGTALKPACEFWTLARKPLSEKTVAANVLKWGTGALNIDASRIGTLDNLNGIQDLEKDTASDLGPLRFRYQAKASKAERNRGLEGMPEKPAPKMDGSEFINPMTGVSSKVTMRQNHHPTVKPLKLMEYLIRLVTPEGGIVLDPFAGSGSTLLAAQNLGFKFIGIEMNEEYVEIARRRLG